MSESGSELTSALAIASWMPQKREPGRAMLRHWTPLAPTNSQRCDSPSSSRSSSPAAPEADSSYGELPFDIDAIEEAMREYD